MTKYHLTWDSLFAKGTSICGTKKLKIKRLRENNYTAMFSFQFWITFYFSCWFPTKFGK